MAGELALSILIKANDMASNIIAAIGDKFGPLGVGMAAVGVAAAGAAVEAVKMAGDFQQATTVLVTSAGESAQNLEMVRQGILNISVETGTATDNLSQGMYMIESAGFHGANGLNVLKAAAMGAKAENADLDTVGTALVTTLTDYHMSADQATQAMNGLIATVASGRTNLQNLAASMGSVLPLASSLGISFPQVAGAIATMTNAGMTAQRASMNLANAIRSLAAPNATAQKAMIAMGLTSQQVSDTLTHQGLAQALQLIEDHVSKKFPEGSAQWTAAMKSIMGGATGLNVALMLGGQNMAGYEGRIKSITDAMSPAQKAIMGWSETQSNFNFKMDQAKQALDVLMIVIGTKLLPAIGPVISAFASLVMAFVSLITTANPLTNFFGMLGNLLFGNAIGINIFLGVLKGLAIFIISLFVPALQAWAIAAWEALAPMLVAAAPFIAVGAAIGALIGIFIYAYQNIAVFREWINRMIATLQQFGQAAIQWIVNTWNTQVMPVLQRVGSWFSSVGIPALIQFGQIAMQWLGQIWQSSILPPLQQAWARLSAFGQMVGSIIGPSLRQFGQTVMELAQRFIAWVQSGGLLHATLTTLNSAWNGLVAAGKIVWAGLVSIWNTIQSQLIPALRNLWNSFSGITGPLGQFLQYLGQIALQVGRAIASFGQWLVSAQGIRTLWGGIVTVLQVVAGVIAIVVVTIARIVGAIAQWLVRSGVLVTVWNAIVATVRVVISVISLLVNILAATLEPVITSIGQTFTGNLLPALKGLWTSIVTLGQSLLAAVLPALKSLWSTLQTLWGVLVSVWKVIGPQLMPILQQLGMVLLVIGAVIGGIVVLAIGLLISLLAGLLVALANIIAGIIRFVGGLIQFVSGIFEVLSGLFSFFIDLFTGNWGHLATDLQTIWEGVVNMFQGLWGMIVGIFQASVGAIWGLISTFVSTIINFFVGLYNAIVGHSIIPDLVKGVLQWFTNLVSMGINFITNLVTSIVRWFLNLSAWVLAAVSFFVNSVLNWMVMMEVRVLATITLMVTIFLSWVDKMTGGAVSKVTGLVGQVGSILGGLGSVALKAGQAIVNGIVNGIMGLWGTLTGTMGKITGLIGSFLPHSPAKQGELSHLNEYGPNLVKGIATGVTNSAPLLHNAMSKLVAPVSSSFSLNASSAGNAFALHAPSNGSNQPQTVNMTVQLDGKTITEVVGARMASEMRIQGGIRRL